VERKLGIFDFPGPHLYWEGTAVLVTVEYMQEMKIAVVLMPVCDKSGLEEVFHHNPARGLALDAVPGKLAVS
jgi:hypothetical protein